MTTRRRPIELPGRLEEQIAALVGQRGRDAFVREAVQQELERKRLLAAMPVTPKTRPKRKQAAAGSKTTRSSAARK